MKALFQLSKTPLIAFSFGLTLSALPALATLVPEIHTKVAVADLPPAVIATVKAAVPGITLTAAERKDRDGRIYYDVEGVKPDGSKVELDLLAEKGGFRVVEIQRDLKWADVPQAVRDVVRSGITPVRVIESVQTDGTIIYELFAAGKPDKPSLEVSLKDGKAAVLTEVWPH